MMMSPTLMPIRNWIGVASEPLASALGELSLDFDCAGDGVHSARELHQRAVAHELDDTTRMGGNRRIDQLTPQDVQT